MAGTPRAIGILLFDDVEELDAVGPYEVLASWTRSFPDDAWTLTTLSADGAAVTGAKGLGLTPHVAGRDAPTLDVLVYPGGMGTRPLLKDADHLDWLRAQRAQVPLIASVCTGAPSSWRRPGCSQAGPRRRTGRPSTSSRRSIPRSTCAATSASSTTATS